MIRDARIPAFLALHRLAFAGARRSGKGISNDLMRELVRHGYDVRPVHPDARALEGRETAGYAGTDGAVLMLPKEKVAGALRQVAEAGVRRVWLQQGSDSPEALALAKDLNLDVIHGRCLFMYLPQVGGFHAFHRGLWKLIGQY